MGTAVGGAVRRTLYSRRGRGGHGGVAGSWFGPGTQERGHGVLFNETPPPPGHKRKWEDWELPCYATGILTVIVLSGKPDTRIETWARKQPLERLATEVYE